MIEKKSSKGNLEKRRTTFLIIGFVVILLLVYLAFEFFATKPKPIDLGPLDPVVIEISEDVPRTDQTPPPPQTQQQQEYLLNAVKNEIEVNLDGIIFSTESHENDIIPPYEHIPIIDDKVDEQPPIHFPEKMPEPQGGMEGMYEFLRANLKYPQVSQYGIAGTVLVEFVVERDGSISNVTIKAGVHPELDKEAMRVVKMLPKWKPGEQLGKPVRCLYNIPISFIIK